MAKNDLKLPAFEGRTPDGVTYALTGKIEHDPIVGEALRLGSEVALVVVGEVTRVAHEEVGDDGATNRAHTIKVERGALMVVEDAHVAVLAAHEEARERAGEPVLPGTGVSS